MTNILWLSRHPMTEEQVSSLTEKLGVVEITQVNGTIQNVHIPFDAEINGVQHTGLKPLKEWISNFDVIAVVAPIGLLQQIVQFAADKPVISALNKRIRIGAGEEFKFEFEKWERITKVEIVKEDF